MMVTGGTSLDRQVRQRAARVLPGITQTYSKAPDQHVDGVYPTYLVSGKGCRVRDLDGREYIDYPCALGPVVLGYGDAEVDAAVHAQVDLGPVFSLGNPLEVEVAEMLVDMIPCAEMVRFVKTGSEATSAAIRLARAVTGRDRIAQCGYHGWHEWCVGQTLRNAGVPRAVRDLTHQWKYNDLASLRLLFEAHPGEFACVVMEPVGVEEPLEGFLDTVVELAHRYGSLVVFDEVITGFRLAPGGAQQHFGVVPDLAAFGKAMANGFAVGAVVGRADIMESVATTTFISGTFAGDPISLAAARATLHAVVEREVCSHLWAQGARLQDGFNALAVEHGVPARMVGLPPRRVLAIDPPPGASPNAIKGLVWQGCLDNGVLLGNANFVSYAHDDEAVERTLSAFDASLRAVRRAIEDEAVEGTLRGAAPAEVFRKP